MSRTQNSFYLSVIGGVLNSKINPINFLKYQICQKHKFYEILEP